MTATELCATCNHPKHTARCGHPIVTEQNTFTPQSPTLIFTSRVVADSCACGLVDELIRSFGIDTLATQLFDAGYVVDKRPDDHKCDESHCYCDNPHTCRWHR